MHHLCTHQSHDKEKKALLYFDKGKKAKKLF